MQTNEGSYSATESEQTEGKPQPPTKKNAEVDVDAVAMLLGLAQGGEDEAAGPSGSGSGDKSRARSKRPLGQAELLLEEAHPDLTKKGVLRLGPGDNRVRPPKAATKLLPEAKWRHIRMPDVESALEAEDWVVMWAHFTHPDVLPKPKAEGLLNFRLSHYDGESRWPRKLHFINVCPISVWIDRFPCHCRCRGGS